MSWAFVVLMFIVGLAVIITLIMVILSVNTAAPDNSALRKIWEAEPLHPLSVIVGGEFKYQQNRKVFEEMGVQQ